MKKTLLAISLLALAGYANAGFASGFAAGSGFVTQLQDNERANQQAGREQQRWEQEQRAQRNAVSAANQGGSWDNPTPMGRRVVAVIPAADGSVNCRFSDGSVSRVSASEACPK